MLLSIISACLLFAAPAGDTLHFPTPQSNTVLNKTKLLRLVNNLRAAGCKCGDTWYAPAAALQWNDQLEAAAQAHSSDMATRKYFAHRSPEGTNAGFRLDKAGYKWKAFGENIGMGFRNEDEVVTAWKDSPSHCKNMLSANFTEMGVAREGVYWTQAFGKR
jgi:uncharacterized protein YkwD